MKKMISALLLAAAVGGVLTACGGGDGAEQAAVEPTGNTVDLKIEATDFQFNEAEYRVKA